MKVPTKVYEARARIAKSMGHPARLVILDALLSQPRCVGELTDIVGSDQSTVSKHLSVLKNAGLISVERKGAMNIYAVRCRCLEDFFACLESAVRQNVEEQQDLIQIEKPHPESLGT